MKSHLLLSGAVALLALAAHTTLAAQGKPDPALQVRNPTLDLKWAGPETRPPAFDKVMLAPVELQFRPVEPMTGVTGYTGDRTAFPVPEYRQQEMAETFSRVFAEELGESRQFSLVTEPGEGVLLIRPSLRDIVSRTPPEEPVGRSAIYTDTVGEATLVLDFVDASSGQLLATAMDRRTARSSRSPGDFGAIRANPVATGFEVRRLARRWGRLLNKRVESLYREALPRTMGDVQ